MEYHLSAITYENDYRGYKAILYNQLSISAFERYLNDKGSTVIPPEYMNQIMIPPQYRGKLGSMLRKHYYKMFVELCNNWRKQEMDKLFLPPEIQEDMFNSSKWLMGIECCQNK